MAVSYRTPGPIGLLSVVFDPLSAWEQPLQTLPTQSSHCHPCRFERSGIRLECKNSWLLELIVPHSRLCRVLRSAQRAFRAANWPACFDFTRPPLFLYWFEHLASSVPPRESHNSLGFLSLLTRPLRSLCGIRIWSADSAFDSREIAVKPSDLNRFGHALCSCSRAYVHDH